MALTAVVAGAGLGLAISGGASAQLGPTEPQLQECGLPASDEPFNAVADIAICDITDQPDPVLVGDEVTYRVFLRNLARECPQGDLPSCPEEDPEPDTARGTTMEFAVLPPNSSVQSATFFRAGTGDNPSTSPPQGTNPKECEVSGGFVAVCHIGDVEPAQWVIVDIVVEAPDTQQMTAHAVVEALPERDPSNNYQSEETDVDPRTQTTTETTTSTTTNTTTQTTTNTTTETEPRPEPPQQRASCKGKRATIIGTNGRDRLRGTGGRDVIVARGGNDSVVARGGKDLVCANAGKDEASGGRKADDLFGQKGADLLKGNKGRDLLVGGRGNDTCRGGRGRDTERSC